jgi:hypothetical protein
LPSYFHPRHNDDVLAYPTTGPNYNWADWLKRLIFIGHIDACMAVLTVTNENIAGDHHIIADLDRLGGKYLQAMRCPHPVSYYNPSIELLLPKWSPYVLTSGKAGARAKIAIIPNSDTVGMNDAPW